MRLKIVHQNQENRSGDDGVMKKEEEMEHTHVGIMLEDESMKENSSPSEPFPISASDPVLVSIEVNGIQLNEEKQGASYLAGLFGSDKPSTTHDNDSDFVDPPVMKSKKFNAHSSSISKVARNSNVSKKTKSVPKEDDRNVGLKELRKLLVDIRS
ncbi:Uncharacterized protein Adt_15318 [Abeliophyllum distichum]|uniref:Uncharacterized protein n=1 Tax=Abeliophyllum distichum TaxID=126358 RepID=A0ABD1U242_9LAMI